MSQKIENILNLAFEATPEERARSAELDVGYDAGERAWDLIIKYSGSLDAAREISESVTELLNNYAVVRIREDRIEALASLPEVEFVEKPKSLYFQVDVGRQVSCIDAVQEAPYDLTGGGYRAFTGTSFAVPFAAGAAALLMEWGIVRGNDPYLYGEKVKAYLRRGARQLPGYRKWPNAQLGYGALCVRDSLPDR